MNANAIRLGIFLAVFVLMLLWERMSPRHPTVDSKPRRMGINLALTGIDILTVRLVCGAAAMGAARFAGENGWGLFNWLQWPAELEAVMAVIVLDFMIYLQHVAVHLVPLFWRFHIVHHSDLDLDVSSGLRFHPVEILGSMAYKIVLVVLLGASPAAVLAFEAILNGMALFTHSNVNIPEPLDRAMRRLLVTPDMHRIHHSVEVDETNSNYGFNLSIWDRLMGTYKSDARKPQPEILIGISSIRSREAVNLPNLLKMPFGHPPANESSR